MKLNQIAVQLYTVRDICRTPDEVAETLKKIADLGYSAIEIAGICEVDPTEMRRMADEAGLKICAFHDAPLTVLNHPEEVAEKTNIFGCEHVVYTYPQGFQLGKKEDVENLATFLTTAGKGYARIGKSFSYHNHAHELMRFGETTVLDYFMKAINPQFMNIELDTYWVQFGGGSPSGWCSRLKERIPLLHVKDYGNIDGVPTIMEIGSGNLEWPDIISAATESGCRWFIVEQDVCPGNPLVSLKASYDYLSQFAN